MSSEQNNPPTDQQIEQLYESLSSPQPPAELDQAILDAAHEAVSPQLARRRPKRRNWYVPVSMAAVVLISFSVVIKLVVDEAALQPATDMSVEPEVATKIAPLAETDNLAPPTASFSGAPANFAPQEESRIGPGKMMQSPMRQKGVRTERQELKKQSGEKAAKRYAPQVTQPPSLPSLSGLASDEERKQVPTQPQQQAIQARVNYLLDLLETRQFDKLQAELTAFRQQHADYPLPAKLLEWSSSRQPESAD